MCFVRIAGGIFLSGVEKQVNEKIIISSKNEMNLLQALVIIAKHKKMIIYFPMACVLITAAASLIMKPVYKAKCSILPPQESRSTISSQILNALTGTSGASKSVSTSLGLSSANDKYVGMLKSRTVYDYIIDRFGLMDLYKVRYRDIARAKLDGLLTIQNGKDDIISISVEDEDPQRAANIANAFIEKLKEITQTLAISEASKRRLFFEEQLIKIKEDLLKSEEAMKDLMEKTGAISVDEQAKAVIESIAGLRAQIAVKEVEIKVMRTYIEPKNPDLQKAQDALKGMKEQLQVLETKTGDNPDPFMSTGEMPQIGTDYARKLREVKYNETLLNLISGQYEIARVDEAKDAIIIQILDKAVPPDKKVKPKRTIMVAAAGFVGFSLAIFMAFILEHMNKAYGDEQNRKMIELIRTYFFTWKSKKVNL
jgi:tyrosine-protein kinase Etk/Wzc